MTSWLEKLLPGVAQRSKKKADIPEGVWQKCTYCGAMLYMPELERAHLVCPKCDGHLRMTADQRLKSFFDEGTVQRFAEEKEPVDRLKFKDLKKYKDRLSTARKTTGETEAIVVAQGAVFDIQIVAAAFEFKFMGGSMGANVGERFIAAVQRAIVLEVPFVCFSASGGARMQEGLFSLMQMAKTSAALTLLQKKGLPFISVLTDPVYGGVSASFAMLGDAIIAEPGAMIGFAGPRVIEQTVRETLPEGFQTSEFLLEKGAIDMIVHRSELRGRICTLVRLLGSSDLSLVPIEKPQDLHKTEEMKASILLNEQIIKSSENALAETEGSIKTEIEPHMKTAIDLDGLGEEKNRLNSNALSKEGYQVEESQNTNPEVDMIASVKVKEGKAMRQGTSAKDELASKNA